MLARPNASVGKTFASMGSSLFEIINTSTANTDDLCWKKAKILKSISKFYLLKNISLEINSAKSLDHSHRREHFPSSKSNFFF